MVVVVIVLLMVEEELVQIMVVVTVVLEAHHAWQPDRRYGSVPGEAVSSHAATSEDVHTKSVGRAAAMPDTIASRSALLFRADMSSVEAEASEVVLPICVELSVG